MIEEEINKKETPTCPDCGSLMNLKTAKNGKNAGSQFFGCSTFPKCRGIVNIDSEISGNLKPNIENIKELSQIPVAWNDRVVRKGWYSEYISIGSMPSFSSIFHREDINQIKQTLSHTFLLENSMRERTVNENAKFIGSMVMKILQRGHVPFCSRGVEDLIVKEFSLEACLTKSKNKESISNELNSNAFIADKEIIGRFSKRSNFIFDDELNVRNSDAALFDSHFEDKFFNEWLPQNISSDACHWLIPQASLDIILKSNGLEGSNLSRVDFLFSNPFDVFVIELDGDDHEERKELDQERDDALATCGIKVIRVPNEEVEKMSGPNLEIIKQRIQIALNHDQPIESNPLLLESFVASTYASKLQYGIARAIKNGWLDSEEWVIKVKGFEIFSAQAVQDIIKMINSFDDIYNTFTCPKKVSLISDESIYEISLKSIKKVKALNNIDNLDLTISIEPSKSPYHEVTGESNDDVDDIIIRPCYVPVIIAVEDLYLGQRRKTDENHNIKKTSLNNFIQDIFRKESLRDSQAKSVNNLLKNIDTVILLPTGAGKSFIYQIAGLLMPGITLVIDPIVALMEDQVEGLFQYGIDRISAISSSQKNRHQDIKRTKNGEFQFIFVSPERLQMPDFRDALRGLAQTSIINLAVIDEAHCVSEWGHDFRPAYLNVSRNIKNIGKDREGISPPITALTGTASRSVLRDVLSDLEIDQSNSNSIIRPDNFDRKELNFYVIKSDSPAYSDTSLSGALKVLPEKFGIPASEFFQMNGGNTFSGVVFVPYVGKGPHVNYGVKKTQELVESSTLSACAMYSGSDPNNHIDWENQKRKNIKDFKYNKIPLLVATKAYGMGIDKPNIRFTVHYGIPSSLEMFYQEAGRAGRDRRDALCGIIYSEYSESKNDSLLDPSISLDELRGLYQVKTPLAERDDVNRQLFFHLGSFEGIQAEVDYVSNILEKIDTLDRDHHAEIRFNNSTDQRSKEKALHRLTKIGVIKDYEVDYSNRTFTIQITIFDLPRCKDNLLNYVSLSTPGRVKTFSDKLKKIDSSSSKDNARMLCGLLIDFTYDIVERARRSALRETVLLARNSANDGEIRSRILDYLQEGVGAAQIEELVLREDVRLDDWKLKINLALSPVDASELRGLAMRFIESYPDHPGLLLTRAITELLCSSSNETISSQSLYSAIQSSKSKYDVDDMQWESILDWLDELPDQIRKKIIPVITLTFYKAIRNKIISNELLEIRFKEIISRIKDPYIELISNIFDTSLALDQLEIKTNIIQNVLSDNKLKELME